MSRRIRVVSFNTAKGDGAYRRRLAAIGEELVALEPDLVLLQEALLTADGRHDTARDLANALGFDYASFAVREKPRLVEGETRLSWSSPAVLTRWALAAVRPMPLPWDPADGERLALAVRIAAPFGVVSVVNAHLTHLRSSDLRWRQLATILESPWLGQAAAVRLLGGDLNAAADAPEIAPLFEGRFGWDAQDALASADEVGGTLVDWATGQRRGPRIDHLIVLRMPEDPPLTVRAGGIVLDGRRRGVTLSDHAGVFAELEVSTRPAPSALV